MKKIKNILSFLRKKKESREENWEERRREKWEAQTSLITQELRCAVDDLQFEKVFELLENGADPNALVYVAWFETIDNGMAPAYYRQNVVHILDLVKDKAMIKLLRSYGASTSREMAARERYQEEQAQREHDIQSGILVDSLLSKQTRRVCFG